jgi:hypothetical protein
VVDKEVFIGDLNNEKNSIVASIKFIYSEKASKVHGI